MASFDLPTDPSTVTSFELWKKDADVWKLLTDVPQEKQGLALQYACRGNPRIHEAVLAVEPAKVKCKEGFQNIVDALDIFFSVAKKDSELQAYQMFETLQRREDQIMADFLLDFDSVLRKIKSHGNVMSQNLLGLKLMRAANLTVVQQQIIKASIKEMEYAEVQAVIKRMFSGDGCNDISEIKQELYHPAIKDQPTFQTTNNKVRNNQSHQAENLEASDSKVFYGYSRKLGQELDGFSEKQRRYSNKPSVSRGESNIKEGSKTQVSLKKGSFHRITLFEGDFDDPISTATLSQECIGAAIADCGASKTVCGKEWLDSYLDILAPEEENLVTYKEAHNIYKFGIGNCKAITTAQIPITLGTKKVMLETDVISHDLPLLLSKATMKRASAMLDTENDTITMLGETIKLINTTSGHYAVPLCRNKALLNEILTADTHVSVSLMAYSPDMSKHDMAKKLHQQFCHATDKLKDLINLSDWKDDEELKNEIIKVIEACNTCKRFKCILQLPVVAVPSSTKFNEVVAMSIKFHQGIPLLHLIDSCTRFSITAVLKSRDSKEITENMCKMWIEIFGCPQEFICDNDPEFANQDFREMSEAMNIRVTTTSAYSPWANTLSENHNQVLGEMVDTILEEVDCALSVAVAWSTSSKNSLQTVQGFSPSQLVFGYNLILPCVNNDKPPALSPCHYEDIITANLEAMRKERKAFLQTESSVRFRRSMNCKTSPYRDVRYITGDDVYYKNPSKNLWSGPANVIGQDGQFILVRHQANWIRVHSSKLQHADSSSKEPGYSESENPSGVVLEDGEINNGDENANEPQEQRETVFNEPVTEHAPSNKTEERISQLNETEGMAEQLPHKVSLNVSDIDKEEEVIENELYNDEELHKTVLDRRQIVVIEKVCTSFDRGR